MRFHLFHPISTLAAMFHSTPRVYDTGEVETAAKTKENTTMPDDHLAGLEDRYRHGYTWRQCEGDITLALLGATPRRYGDVMLLTRANDHPDPDTAPPAVVLARNAYGLAVLELFDLPDSADRAVVDLAAERDRRRSAAKAGEGA